MECCSIKLKKKHIYFYLKCVMYDKLLKPRQSFRITLYIYCQKQNRTSGSHGKWLWRIFSSGMWENVNLKQSLQAWKSPDGSQIWTQSAHGRSKVVSSTHRPPWPPRSNGTNFCYSLEGLCERKIPMSPLGIEPATFRLVAKCLNYLRHQHQTSLFKSVE